MNYQGSCVAIFSSHAYPKILKVVKYLQTEEYLDKQLSVMGRRANSTRMKSGFLRLFKSSDDENSEQYFWNNLRYLLRGKISFKTSHVYSINILGELSQPSLEKNATENSYVSYAEITKLLHLVGIPKVSFEHYKAVLKKGQLLLIISGNYQELKRAANLLDLSGNINVSLHLANTS